MSFDHCAGRRSGSASAFRPEATIVSAISCTRSNGVSSYGPSQVSVSRMYSTCVSECRVPLMNVTAGDDRPVAVLAHDLLGAEAVEHGHHVASGNAPSSACTRRLEPARLRRDDREVGCGELGRVGRGDRRAREARSCRSREAPRAFSASACSRRRVSTETSHTCARCPAKRLPMTPAPTMQTRSITP